MNSKDGGSRDDLSLILQEPEDLPSSTANKDPEILVNKKKKQSEFEELREKWKWQNLNERFQERITKHLKTNEKTR